MWSLSSLRGLCSSSSIAINGSLKPFSHMASRFTAASPDCLESFHCAPYALNFESFIHSVGRKDEMWRNSEPLDFGGVRGQDNSQTGRSSKPMDIIRRALRQEDNSQIGWNSRPMDVIRRAVEQDSFRRSQYKVEQNPHFVLIQLKRNSTHINVTDSKGDTKFWTSSGNKAVGGGGKVSRYAAEATAEHVGRRVREMGLKSVVVRVKGFTYFKKKRQAIMSFKEGFSSSRSDDNPIVYIEDVTRKPHNGCRLPKKRRI